MPEVPQAALVQIPGIQAFQGLAAHPFLLSLAELRHDRAGNGPSDLVLQIEYVREIAVVPLRPDVIPGGRVDELGRDAYAVAATAHAALEHIAHAQLAADAANIVCAPLVGKRRIACDHHQPLKFRQCREQVLGDPVGEILLVGVIAEVVERQHGNSVIRHRALGRGGRGAPEVLRGRADPLVGMHRVGNVLDRLRALVGEARANPSADGALDRRRDRDAARRCEALQARGNVDPVAVHRAVGFFDDFAQMYADANAHAAIFGCRFSETGQLALHRDRCGHGPARRIEHGKDGVTRRVDDAPAVRLDVLTEHRPRGVERIHRRTLILRHEARIAAHVGGENRGQALSEFGWAHRDFSFEA